MGPRHSIRVYFRRIISNCYSHEILTLIYLLATGLITVLRAPQVANWQNILLFHFALSIVIIAYSFVPENLFRGAHFVRSWYLFFLFPLLFKELTTLTQSLFPYYLEPYLIRSELFLIGLYDQYFSWIARTPLLTEIMAFSYWSYYLMIFGIGIYLYRSIGETEHNFYLFKIFATFLFSYSLFILVPVRGPHHAMNNIDPTSLDGYLFQSIILFMQSKGSTIGAAFPSSHVAVAWICVFTLRQFEKRVYYMLMPLMILLMVSVFYLRYHYFLDAIFGYFLAIWLERRYILMSEKVKLRFIEKRIDSNLVLKQEYELDN